MELLSVLLMCPIWVFLVKSCLFLFHFFCQIVHRLFSSIYLLILFDIEFPSFDYLFFNLLHNQNILLFILSLLLFFLSVPHSISLLQKSWLPGFPFKLTLRFLKYLLQFTFVVSLYLFLDLFFHTLPLFCHLHIGKLSSLFWDSYLLLRLFFDCHRSTYFLFMFLLIKDLPIFPFLSYYNCFASSYYFLRIYSYLFCF